MANFAKTYTLDFTSSGDTVYTGHDKLEDNIDDIITDLLSLKKNWSSGTAPSSPALVEGQFWWDSTNDIQQHYDGSAWYTTGGKKLVIGKSGTGDGTVHIETATAGSVTADSTADDLVIENSAAGGISILVPNNANASLIFGSPTDAVGAKLQWNHDSDLLTLSTNNAGGDIQLQTGDGAACMTLDDGQNVGIGLTGHTIRLEVKDDTADHVTRFFNDGNNINRTGIEIQCGADDQSGSNSTYITITDGNGGAEGSLQVQSGALTLVNTSDEKTKQKIEATKMDGTAIVKLLKIKDFEWKKNPKNKGTGLIAQDVQSILPKAVSAVAKDGTLGIGLTHLFFPLLKAVQELEARITTIGG